MNYDDLRFQLKWGLVDHMSTERSMSTDWKALWEGRVSATVENTWMVSLD